MQTSTPAIESHQVVPLHKSRKKQAKPLEVPPQKDRLLRKDKVKERIGIEADSSLYKMVTDGKFPAPIHIHGGRSSFWLESEVDNWLNNVIAAAGKEVVR